MRTATDTCASLDGSTTSAVRTWWQKPFATATCGSAASPPKKRLTNCDSRDRTDVDILRPSPTSCGEAKSQLVAIPSASSSAHAWRAAVAADVAITYLTFS